MVTTLDKLLNALLVPDLIGFGRYLYPLATGLKIGAEETQPQLTQPNAPELNTLGAKVTTDTVPAAALTTGCMYPYLAVSETEAVESQLEIFYESSTSGNLIDLNRQVISDYGGVSGTTTNCKY